MLRDRKSTLPERIEACRLFSTELSKNAGITKALNEKIKRSSDGEERYFLKSLFECQFNQLMIGLNILSLDGKSEIRIEKMITDFERIYGGKLKQAGLAQDIEKEQRYGSELKETIELWSDIRNQYAAHKAISPLKDWKIDADKISIFISSVQKIVNTMSETISVPQSFVDGTINSASYTISTAIDLEEESYRIVLSKLKWQE